ncbi:hypothetical protein MRX96_041739 [Rhipicephalus microplus]
MRFRPSSIAHTLLARLQHQWDASATAPLMSTREVTRHRQTGFTESGAQRHPEERPETRLSETTPPHRPHARSRAAGGRGAPVGRRRRSTTATSFLPPRGDCLTGDAHLGLNSRTEGLAGEGENSAYESGSEESRWTTDELPQRRRNGAQ